MFPLPEKWTTIAYIYFYIYLYLARTKEVSHLFVFLKNSSLKKNLVVFCSVIAQMTMLIAKRQVNNCPSFSGTEGSWELEIFTKNVGDAEVTLHGQKYNKFTLNSCKLIDFVLATIRVVSAFCLWQQFTP